MIIILLMMLVFAPTVAAACESDTMALVQQGKALFNGKAVCFGCHGTNADGVTHVNPDVPRLLDPQPTDLRNPAALRFLTDAARYDVIKNGIPGTAMVPFRGMLYDQQIRELIEYLDVLGKGGC